MTFFFFSNDVNSHYKYMCNCFVIILKLDIFKIHISSLIASKTHANSFRLRRNGATLNFNATLNYNFNASALLINIGSDLYSIIITFHSRLHLFTKSAAYLFNITIHSKQHLPQISAWFISSSVIRVNNSVCIIVFASHTKLPCHRLS